MSTKSGELHHHHNWRPVGIVILAGAVIATAPFPLLQISFRDYMAAVLVLSLHEFEWTLILRTGSLLAVMLWLLWYMRARDRGASDHDSIVLRNGLIAFAIAGFVIVIMAGKQGAGPHFLVPLAPSAAWLSTRMWQRFRSNADWEHQFDRGLVRLMAAMTLVLVIGIGESQGRVVKGLGKPNSEAVNAIEVL